MLQAWYVGAVVGDCVVGCVVGATVAIHRSVTPGIGMNPALQSQTYLVPRAPQFVEFLSHTCVLSSHGWAVGPRVGRLVGRDVGARVGDRVTTLEHNT